MRMEHYTKRLVHSLRGRSRKKERKGKKNFDSEIFSELVLIVLTQVLNHWGSATWMVSIPPEMSTT